MTVRPEFLIYLIVMAGVTYLIRMIPMVVFKERIKSRFILSFLYYVPYAVLSAMVFPAIFYASGNVASATVGFIVAVLVSFFGKSLVTVALCSCTAVLAAEIIIPYIM